MVQVVLDHVRCERPRDFGEVMTKSGLPLGYEVFHGNQAEPTTLDG